MKGTDPNSQRVCPWGRDAAPVHPDILFDREDFIERLMGDQDLAKRLARGFIDDMPRQLALLAAAVEERDPQQVRLVAHSIKGAAGSVSGLELREVASKLEQQGKAGDWSAADGALPELSVSFARFDR